MNSLKVYGKSTNKKSGKIFLRQFFLILTATNRNVIYHSFQPKLIIKIFLVGKESGR